MNYKFKMIDLYKILKINKKASKKDVKKAYRNSSKIHHPDKGGKIEDFNLISKAYQILMNDDKRKRYDDGESIDDILYASNNKSLSIIATMFCVVIENLDPNNENIIERMKSQISLNTIPIRTKIDKLNVEKKRCESFLKKLKHKDKNNNIMNYIANGQIKIKKDQIDLLKKEQSDFEKAEELLEDFDYEIVKSIMITGLGSFNSTSTNF